MIIDRRQALALTAVIAASAAIGEAAQACSQRPPPAFRPSARDRRRMVGQLKLFRTHWNDGTPDRFVAAHCTEHVEINLLRDGRDGRDGRWSDPADTIRQFHAQYPRISTRFSGVMFDPLLPILYTMAAFEAAPRIGAEDAEILLCQRAGMAPAFAIQMRFAEARDPKPPRLPEADRIVTAISLRPHGFLANGFQSTR